jgi:predicted small lipoprotein YifL
MSFRQSIRRFFLSLIAVVLLAGGCGQKGDLYLPDGSASHSTAATQK